jgi:hypothetical protein
MKYIKDFNSVGYGTNWVYWKIPNKKPEILIALKKLKKQYGCDITEHYFDKQSPKYITK